MESANFHHHQQQDYELVDSSPFLSWSQNQILTGTNNGANSMVQDLGFSWSSSGTNNINGMGHPMDHELQRLARIMDEFSVEESYPKFLELLNCSSISNTKDLHFQPFDSSYIKNEDSEQIINDQNCYNGALSHISSISSSSSSSFDMNCLPPLDLFGSPRFNGSFSDHSSINVHNLGGLSYGLHQQNHNPLVCYGKVSSVVSTTRSTDQSSKRPASKCIDTNTSAQSVAQKKSKSEARISSTPFQVRKEKLGDRIAAIQQLVAPFGKTDTASVLMEAFGYIKFLQTQIETLSVPYMQSSDKIDGISTHGGQMEDGNKGAKRELRSRGLCLVPLSCLSYVTDGNEGIWPTP